VSFQILDGCGATSANDERIYAGDYHNKQENKKPGAAGLFASQAREEELRYWYGEEE